jgi:hypothetical protein
MGKEIFKTFVTSTHFEILEDWGHIELRIDNATFLPSVSIYIQELEQKKGLSRILVKQLCSFLRSRCVAPAYIYIDTDASAGFWSYMGFVPNPLVEDETVPEFGYEKRCAWETFCYFGAKAEFREVAFEQNGC